MMPNMQPQATPAPIHDIADPVWMFSYSPWAIAAVGAGLLLLIGLVIWLLRRKRTAKQLTPREKALAALAELRRQDGSADPYAFGIRISDALRAYIRDQWGVDAVTRTSFEFLDSVRDSPFFTPNEKGALSEFLESADLLKYARQDAGAEEIGALLEIAERLITGAHSPVPEVQKS